MHQQSLALNLFVAIIMQHAFFLQTNASKLIVLPVPTKVIVSSVLVAFTSDYSYNRFIESMLTFAYAMSCGNRNALLVHFYFGSIDHHVQCVGNLVDCLSTTLIDNATLSFQYYKVSN
jgi:hypothetical protein